MIKGLYFKLNLDNERDKHIYDFFNYERVHNRDKIDLLSRMIMHWKADLEDYTEIIKYTDENKPGG